MRRRLGEHGLSYQVITVPHSRPDRHIVQEVSGQLLVPVLVVEENGERLVLSDENDIHAYLDANVGPMPEHQSKEPTQDEYRDLAEQAPRWMEMSEWLFALAERARAAGENDDANCLRVSAQNLFDAGRWIRNSLPVAQEDEAR